MAYTGSYCQDLRENLWICGSNMEPSCNIATSALGPEMLVLEVFPRSFVELAQLVLNGLGLAGGYKW